MENTRKWMSITIVIVLAGAIVSGIIWMFMGPVKGSAYLPGIYTCIAQNEFCRIDDTLVIRRTKMEEDNYSVTRTTAFIRIRAGKKAPTEYQQQHWQAHYEIVKSWLISSNEADTVRYYPEKNRVSKASFYYEKIE